MNANSNGYMPQPIDTSDVVLSEALLALAETLAANTQDVWALGKMRKGYVYGAETSDADMTHRDLSPYGELSEAAKDYDRNTSIETLKVLVKLGWTLTPPEA